MSSETNTYLGFELVNALADKQLSKKEDVLVLFLHWYLVRNGFKCIGFGDSKIFDPTVNLGSEILPEGWNQQPNYALRYVKDGQLYIVIATKSDTDLLINLLKIENNCVSNIQFPIESTVSSIHGPLETLIPNHSAVFNKIQKDLVEPVCSTAGREISTQTPPRQEIERRHDPNDDPLRVGPPRIAPRNPWNPQVDPRDIGRSDLDPFARSGPSGGGMLFDPFAPQRGIPNPLDPRAPGGLGVPGRLPPGAVPPGARFDPFGPPEIHRQGFRRDPDADHLPPPGYDDMFM